MPKAKLNNSLTGWVLVPLEDAAVPALERIYGLEPTGQNYHAMTPSHRSFLQGEPVSRAIEEIKKTAPDCGVRVSFCGDPDSPTVQVWCDPPQPAPEKISVDLKWSAWSGDESTWNDHAPGVWNRIQDAFTGKAGPVTINTSARKELRHGTVTIRKGRADGVFITEWDEPESLADTLNTTHDQAFRDTLPWSQHTMEPGCELYFDVKARKFPNFMQRIDENEAVLIAQDAEAWKDVENMFKPRPTAEELALAE